MNLTDGDLGDNSRRSFLLSSGGFLTSVWVTAQWPAIAAAAHHAEQMSEGTAQRFEFLNAAEAADVDAIAAQIVPSGETPGAREAHAIHFIDRRCQPSSPGAGERLPLGPDAVSAPSSERAQPAAGSFAHLGSDAQIAYLKTVENTAFFETVRHADLTRHVRLAQVRRELSGIGWKSMGFDDEHVFAPPFGYYDAKYTGFVPYTTEKSDVSGRTIQTQRNRGFRRSRLGRRRRSDGARAFAGRLHRPGVRAGAAPGRRPISSMTSSSTSFLQRDHQRSGPQSANVPKDSDRTAERPGASNPLIYARLVGGSSNHFTANFWRFHEIDFHERSVLGSIPGTGFADWPISYQELEPYYTKVEWEVGVSRAWRTRVRSIRRARSPIRCRRCR